MSATNERRENSAPESGTNQEEGSTVREDANTDIHVQEQQPSANLETADIARGANRAAPSAREEAPLFTASEGDRFRARWDEVQASFVDDPRQTVEKADALVAEVIKRLAEVFAGERDNLERQWERGEDVSTEDLRIALQRYRSFFTRLLSL